MTYMFKVIHYCLQMCLKTLEIYLEIYELDTTYFVSAPGLAWHVCLKKTGEKLELITGCDMLLMIEKGIRGGIYQAGHRYAKANNLYGWAMSQKMPINRFKWVKQNKKSKFNEHFIKKMMKIVIHDIFLK